MPSAAGLYAAVSGMKHISLFTSQLITSSRQPTRTGFPNDRGLCNITQQKPLPNCLLEL